MDINTVKARAVLPINKNRICWQRIARHRAVGVRKIGPGRCVWWARVKTVGFAKCQRLDDFGDTGNSFTRAVEAANEWARFVLNAPDEAGHYSYAVIDACKDYVSEIRGKKGTERKAREAEARLERLVYSDPLANVPLAKLKVDHIVAWKNRLEALPAKVSRDPDKNVTRERAQSTVNRDMVALRAALNRAYERGLTQSDAAWRLELKPTPNVDGRREAYLKSADRRRLVENADKEIRPFLTLLTLLPLRPGAAAALTVAGYDPREGVLKIPEEKGHRERPIAVPKSTGTFLAKCTKGKPPTAPLVGRSGDRPWSKDSWKGPIKEAVARAKLPENVTAYTLRHSTITDMANAGTPALLVAELSGTSVQIIQKHYFKRDDERDRRALAHLKL